ncbi:hypothetical protein Hdeb2414_s0025g00664491 [Helianthus debilis subsp. tardiflorus]
MSTVPVYCVSYQFSTFFDTYRTGKMLVSPSRFSQNASNPKNTTLSLNHFARFSQNQPLSTCCSSQNRLKSSQFLGFQDDQIWSASKTTVRFLLDSNPISWICYPSSSRSRKQVSCGIWFWIFVCSPFCSVEYTRKLLMLVLILLEK